MTTKKISLDIKKKKALNEFVIELQKRLSNKIFAIHLFGSSAKGYDEPDSDIDVLVVYSKSQKKTVEDILLDVSYKILLKSGVDIEPFAMSEKEFRKEMGNSPFLWEVINFGIPIFSKAHFTNWKLDFEGYIELANEYLEGAKEMLKNNKVRLSVDAGYNAIELLAKALIISKGEKITARHGGILNQFCKLYVLTGKISRSIGKELKRSFKLRNTARYEPKAQITSGNGEFVIRIAENLLEFAKKELK